MAPGIIEHDGPAIATSPADVWRTNGGIYLGLTPKGRTDQKRPLAGQDDQESVAFGYQYRTTWQPDGGLNLYEGEGHVGTWGPQGSGKSRKLLMPNLYKLRDWSCVVIDPKGELCAHTAVWRSQQQGHKVYVIDPFGVIKNNYPKLYKKHRALFKSKGFNPVSVLQSDKPSFNDDVKALAMALIKTEDAHNPYFPMAAQALVKGLIMALRVDEPGQSDSLPALRAWLGQSPEMMATMNKLLLERLGKEWPAIAANLSEFTSFHPEDREIGGIRRTAKTETEWLDSPLIQADLQKKNKMDFATFKDRPQTCYFILPPGELENHAVWLRLMVTAALRPMMRSVERAPVPVLFMLDEIAALGHMKFLVKNIGQMRGFGIKLWTVWQDIDQMQQVYPKEWGTIMSTAEAKVTFTSGDVETREYFSRLSGERLYTHTTLSTATNTSSQSSLGNHQSLAKNILHDLTNQSTSFNESTSEHRMNERVIKPYEIAALDRDEAVIFSRRGRMDRTICPQPNSLPGVGEQMKAARAEIEGTAEARPLAVAAARS